MQGSIRGDILTTERVRKGDLRIEQSPDRGGISFFAPSYIDILAEIGTITQAQRDYGLTWYAIKEVAFAFLQTTNALFRDFADYEIENIEPICRHLGCTSDDALQLFILVTRQMGKLHAAALNACCSPTHGRPLAILWAYQEHVLQTAFERLESLLPKCREELETKNSTIPLQQ